MHLFLTHPRKTKCTKRSHCDADTYMATTAVLLSPALQKILARAVAKAKLLSSWVGSPLQIQISFQCLLFISFNKSSAISLLLLFIIVD